MSETESAVAYRDRIVRVERNVDPNTLNPNPYNFRLHHKPQKETMDGVLKDIGFIGAIMASDKTRNVIDGHMRVDIYLKSNQLIPIVVFIDLEDEEEERRAILTFDQVGDMARTSREILKDVINNTIFNDEKARDLVEKFAKKKNIEIDLDNDTGKMIAEVQKDDGDKDEMTSMFERLIKKWDVNKNKAWAFSGNRIIIKGDCTDSEIIKLIKSFNPKFILTDPPYGLDIVGSDGRIGLAKNFGDIIGDTKPFSPESIMNWKLPSIIWGANNFSSKLPDFPQMLIWNKKGEGNESNDFADAEIAWHSEGGVIRIFDHVWRGAARASERGIDRIHPTQKPIALFDWCIEKFIRNTPEKKDTTILDLYGGSGTLLISAGRDAICVEKDERYVAATIERVYNHLMRTEMPEVLA